MSRLLIIIFTENSNLGASMLCSLANEYKWKADIYFFSPTEYNEKNDNNIKVFIEKYKPNLISLSFKSFERNHAIYLAKTLKKYYLKSNIKLIAGGIHPTLMPHDISEYFDSVIVGDGMGIWKYILDNYTNFSNGEIIYGKHLLDINKYTKYYYSNSQIERMKNTETATMITSIGCPYKCTFCHSGSKEYINFPVENVARHMIELYTKYSVKNFHFLDDLFASNINRLKQLRKIIEQYRQLGIDIGFSSQISGRVSTFNDEIAEELIKLGVETVNFGVETTSPKLLEFLNKQQSPEQCYNAINICHNKGLNCIANLMFGIPTQDEDDYKCALDFVKESKPDGVQCFYYSPYPGTKLYEYCFDKEYLIYNREKFDWFNSNLSSGINDIQIRLSNIDYNLANEYIEKINLTLNTDKDKYLFERMKIIDDKPWILIGTTRHYYFKILAKKLMYKKWKNFLGYVNTDIESGFYIDNNDMKYNAEKGEPFWCVTHSFLGSDFKSIEQYVKNNLGNIPLISISSFKRSHSIEDIKKIKDIKYNENDKIKS